MQKMTIQLVLMRLQMQPKQLLGIGILAVLIFVLFRALAPDPRISWAVFPLPRRQPHDGLAVINQPDGYGLHIFLEIDTSEPSICTPLWLPDPARLFNGNGTAPFSSGLASRQEFFEAVKRRSVQTALRKQLKSLCQRHAPNAQWRWQDPPKSLKEIKPLQLPAFEEDDLLTNPNEELERQQDLFNDKSKAE